MMQNAGFYRRRLGDLTVTALFDGTIDETAGAILGIGTAEAEQLQARSFREAPLLALTVYAVTSGDTTVLIDAGGRPELDPDLGLARGHLRAAGIDPETIQAVLLTHLHTDHYGGLIRADGSAAFPNAGLVVPLADRAFRLDPPDPDALEPAQRASVETARKSLAPYRNRTRFVTAGTVLPGIEAVPLPGHTPGHTGWRVSSGAESLLVWGDLVHFPAVQFARPQASLRYDTDPALAAQTRARMFSEASRSGQLVAGMHLDFPGFGHVAEDGQHFRWVPERWRLQG